jgi:hypothetical protein
MPVAMMSIETVLKQTHTSVSSAKGRDVLTMSEESNAKCLTRTAEWVPGQIIAEWE